MTEEQLHQHIEDILPEINKDKVRGVSFSSQVYFQEKDIEWGDADYIGDKLVEFGLVRRSSKYRTELILEGFGQDVIRDGGWLAYVRRISEQRATALEAESARKAAEDRKADENVNLNRQSARAARVSAKNAIIANIIAVCVALGSFAISKYENHQSGAKVDSLIVQIHQLHIRLDSISKVATKLPISDSISEAKPVNVSKHGPNKR